MIQEAYVSFETAKLLKEKGFNEECQYFYREGTLTKWPEEPHDNEYSSYPAAPTHQMVFAWLREIYNIHIVILPAWIYVFYKNNQSLTQQFISFNSYEEACEAAIQYALKHLI